MNGNSFTCFAYVLNLSVHKVSNSKSISMLANIEREMTRNGGPQNRLKVLPALSIVERSDGLAAPLTGLAHIANCTTHYT